MGLPAARPSACAPHVGSPAPPPPRAAPRFGSLKPRARRCACAAPSRSGGGTPQAPQLTEAHALHPHPQIRGLCRRPRPPHPGRRPPCTLPGNKNHTPPYLPSQSHRYAAFAGVLGLLVPAAACAFAASSSHPAALAAAAPHLYLTCAQVLCECFSSGSTTAALPRMLVPIGFNTYRMGTLITWVAAASAAGLGPAHVALAGANLVFWAYNLFGFLLPNMLPRYLDPKKCAT